MEILAGARDEAHLRHLRCLLARATVFPTGPADYEAAASFYRTCRRSGETVRKLIDRLIAAVAIRENVPVLHADVDFEALARHTAILAAITTIDDDDWDDIDYTDGGRAQVAETTYWGYRLVVRRTRLNNGEQGVLFDTWRHHAFLTNTPDDDGADTETVDARHRHHAVVELAIRDLKGGAGLDHCPSGDFHANSAWMLLCATLAHNMIRWLARLGLGITGPVVAKTICDRYLRVAGRLVHPQGRPTLRLPSSWPWRHSWLRALDLLRAGPALC